MSGSSEKRWVWCLSVAAAVLVVGLGLMSRQINGRLIYALDDPYIHMSVARNLAQQGVWGLHGPDFMSASSAPLWTLLLAGVYRLEGPGDWAPLVLNALAAMVSVLAAGALLKTCGVHGTPRIGALLAAILLGPLGPIGLTGMEHLSHAAATVGFVWLAVRVLDRGKAAGAAAGGGLLAPALLAAAAVVTGLRFEGLFMAAGVVLLLLLQRRWLLAAGLVASAWLPVALYAWYSTAHGSMWRPNPIAVKGNMAALGSTGSAVTALAGKWFTRDLLVRGAGVLMLIATAAVALARTSREERRSPGPRLYAAAIFIIGALLHLQFANLGWFFRYEMYLVVLGVLVVAPFWPRLARPGPDLVAAAMLALTAVPLLVRAEEAHRRAPRATREIAIQQVEMAHFLARYYNGRVVAVNDIGAISWYTDVTIFDLWGLADVETARLLIRETLDGPTIARMATERSVAVALVYDEVLGKPGPNGKVPPPPGWTKVATWKMSRNVVAANWQVTIYSVGAGEEAALREHLREFAPGLPAEEKFTETPAPLPPPPV